MKRGDAVRATVTHCPHASHESLMGRAGEPPHVVLTLGDAALVLSLRGDAAEVLLASNGARAWTWAAWLRGEEIRDEEGRQGHRDPAARPRALLRRRMGSDERAPRRRPARPHGERSDPMDVEPPRDVTPSVGGCGHEAHCSGAWGRGRGRGGGSTVSEGAGSVDELNFCL